MPAEQLVGAAFHFECGLQHATVEKESSGFEAFISIIYPVPLFTLSWMIC
jgi:hypothetical protein